LAGIAVPRSSEAVFFSSDGPIKHWLMELSPVQLAPSPVSPVNSSCDSIWFSRNLSERTSPSAPARYKTSPQH
jgi:hypothetical protein